MPIYDSIYNLLNQYIYGNPEVLNAYQELTLTQISTAFSVLTVSLPIVVIYMLLKFFLGSIARY